MPTLSVWETLQFTTDLRLPESFTKADKEALMTEALHNMGLQKVKHSQVRDFLALDRRHAPRLEQHTWPLILLQNCM